jgi:hypothetical protein
MTKKHSLKGMLLNKCLIFKDTSDAPFSRQTLTVQASARSLSPYEQVFPRDDEDAAIVFSLKREPVT